MYRQFYFGGLGATAHVHLVVRFVFVMFMMFMMFVRVSWWSLVYNSVETVVLVSGVVNGTNGTVWFDQRVLAYLKETIK